MKTFLITFIFCLIIQSNINAKLLINELSCASTSDWVELFFESSINERMEISGLFVTMYYGTNESLSSDPIYIYSYDRPETTYDDRYIIVHLAEPGNVDETDLTGDTNSNGYIDVYCNNYYASLWNSDCVVAIDTDDNPENGGIIDFIAYSNIDGTPNSTIESYILNAQSLGEWQDYSGTNIQECAVDIGKNGLDAHMSISRKKLSDTNSANDFVISKFQTPGKNNILSIKRAKNKLFKILKKKILISSSHPGKSIISLFIKELCNIKLRLFSSRGTIIYNSKLFKDVTPGHFSISWDTIRIKHKTVTGLYIGLIEATNPKLKKSENETVFIIINNHLK